LGKLVVASPSKPQGADREGGAEGSGERNRGSTYRNRMRGAASQGERANDREALATKDWGRISGDRAGKSVTLTWGALASCPKGRRPSRDERSEKSAEAVGTASSPGRDGEEA